MPDCTQPLRNVKIARVSTVAFFVDTQLRSQIGAIIQAGALVTVVASEKSLRQDIPQSCYVSIDIPRRIELIRDVVALVKLWVFFRRYGFQVVHSTTPKAGLLCCVAGRLAGVPVRLHTFTGQPWVRLQGMKRYLSKLSEKLITILNTHCYADSPSQREFIIQSGIARADRISVVGAGSVAGIDLERFNPDRFTAEEKRKLKASLGIPLDSPVLLFVGRLARDKGLCELLAAYDEVLAKGETAYLVVLGPHEAETDSLLDGLSDRVRERLILPGFTDEPERFMAIAQMLLLPSYREGFGTVVIEAAAMGIPAIGSKIYGLTDAILDGKTGVLVPVRDVGGLAAAVLQMLRAPALCSEMGRNAQERVRSEFSNAHVNRLVINEYLNLLRSKEHL